MHGIKLMVACSSSTKSAIVYKVGGVLWKWLYSVFKMGKSEEETSLPLLLGHNTEQTRKKHLYCSEIYEQRRFITASLWYWSNLSTNFEFSKCYLLGRLCMTNATDYNWRKMPHSDHLKWRHWWFLCSQVLLFGVVLIVSPSTGISLDKCWTVNFHHCPMTGCNFVTNITQTQALTWVLNAVSATCWGTFVDIWSPVFPLKNVHTLLI